MPYDTAQFLITQGASSQIYNTCGYWISLVCIFMFSGLFVAPLARTNTCVEEAVVSWPFPLKQPSKRPGGIWTCWQLHRISSYTLSTKYLNNGKQQLGSAWSIFKYHRRIVFLIAFSLSCYASAIINNLMPFLKKYVLEVLWSWFRPHLTTDLLIWEIANSSSWGTATQWWKIK